jgi:ABC-type transport system substrate-binding protein
MNVSDYHENPLRVTAVRQAIRLALDVQSLAEDLNSKRWSAQSGFCPAVLRPSGNAPRHDREKAIALLSGSKFTLTIDHAAGSPRSHVVQILVKQLADVGIKLKSRAVSGRQFFADLKARQHQLALLSWNADYFDPHSNAHTFCVNSDIENRNDASTSQTAQTPRQSRQTTRNGRENTTKSNCSFSTADRSRFCWKRPTFLFRARTARNCQWASSTVSRAIQSRFSSKRRHAFRPTRVPCPDKDTSVSSA